MLRGCFSPVMGMGVLLPTPHRPGQDVTFEVLKELGPQGRLHKALSS